MSKESSPVFDALSDADCRAIIRAIGRPLTAREVATRCDLPLSTAYRKLDALQETPLVEQTYRLRERGKHPQQYQRSADSLLVRFPDERVEVTVVPHALVD
ncbi:MULTISPECIES: helix-turn-helix domain-containing protein [Salinibaculum]|uniref:helix-turn-helix domain-containing protein n=1 Tax=Salinibaculum TaxID=2732368 RepID=UPI0030CDE807